MRTFISLVAAYLTACFVAGLVFPLPFDAHRVQRGTILINAVFPIISISALAGGRMNSQMWSFLGVFLVLFLPLTWLSVRASLGASRVIGSVQDKRESAK